MGALPVGNRDTLAELSVPALPPAWVCCRDLSGQRLLFPAAQHRVAGAQLSSVVPNAREPLRPSTQAPLLLADGSGRGRTQRRTGIRLTFAEMWGVEGREGPSAGSEPRTPPSSSCPGTHQPSLWTLWVPGTLLGGAGVGPGVIARGA